MMQKYSPLGARVHIDFSSPQTLNSQYSVRSFTMSLINHDVGYIKFCMWFPNDDDDFFFCLIQNCATGPEAYCLPHKQHVKPLTSGSSGKMLSTSLLYRGRKAPQHPQIPKVGKAKGREKQQSKSTFDLLCLGWILSWVSLALAISHVKPSFKVKSALKEAASLWLREWWVELISCLSIDWQRP